MLDRDTQQGGVGAGLSNSQVQGSFHSPVQPPALIGSQKERTLFWLDRGLMKGSREEAAVQWSAVSF